MKLSYKGCLTPAPRWYQPATVNLLAVCYMQLNVYALEVILNAPRKQMKKNKPRAKATVDKPLYRDFFAHAAEVMAPEAIEASERMAEEIMRGIHLAALRQHEGLRQEDVPGFTQESVSRLESRADIKLSTYERYLQSLQYDLVVLAVPKKAGKALVVLEGAAHVAALRRRIPIALGTSVGTKSLATKPTLKRLADKLAPTKRS